jgi:adenine-specific DNA-methyltransferase
VQIDIDMTKFASIGIDRFKRERTLSHGQAGHGNAIFRGNNLEVLSKLGRPFKGKVRCVYLDPPYNNQERYTHYDDILDHDVWLAEVSQRLRLLLPLLTDDGSLWISIDDREAHHLKVAADGIFGRKNFITTIVWQQRTTRENRKVFSNNHEYVLLYAKNAEAFKRSRNRLPLPDSIRERYKNPDDDERGPWQSISANVQDGHATKSQFYTLISPNGKPHSLPNGRCWVYNEAKMKREISSGNLWFGRDGNGSPRIKRFLSKGFVGLTPDTLWLGADVGTTDTAKKHQVRLFPRADVFDTPKPEQLLHRILHIATNPGDLVLDPYLGSGTTAAVAHKMKRRYIGIELNAHAAELSAKRLHQIIGGEQGGISDIAGWTEGGGFDFLRAYP